MSTYLSEYGETSLLRISQLADAVKSPESAIPREMQYVLLVSIAEWFVDDWIEDAAIQKSISNSVPDFLKCGVEAYVNNASRTWKSRNKALAELAALSTVDCPSWSAFEGLVDARNAFTHGRGALSRFQMANPLEVIARLYLAGVNTDRGRIRVTDDSWSFALATVRGVVTWLDARLTVSFRA